MLVQAGSADSTLHTQLAHPTSLQATLQPGSSFHAVSVLNNVISVYQSHISLAFMY